MKGILICEKCGKGLVFDRMDMKVSLEGLLLFEGSERVGVIVLGPDAGAVQEPVQEPEARCNECDAKELL